MYMIVILHIISHGTNLIHNHSINNISNILYIIVYSSVNCFALASGYVMVNQQFKLHRILIHWLQVVFFSLIIYLVYIIINQEPVTSNALIRIFTPVSSSTYWYFTVYALLFLFMPFYNFMINRLGLRLNLVLIILLIMVFSVFSSFSIDIFFSTNAGYSFWWISIMYYLGGFTSRYLKKLNSIKFALVGFCTSNILTALGLFLKNIIIKNNIVALNQFADGLSLGYNKLTVALSAWFLLIIFSNITVANNIICKVIKTVSGLTFGVYLIHDNEIIRLLFINGQFLWIENLNPLIAFSFILVFALCIFCVCLLIEYCRTNIFKWIMVDKLCVKISEIIYRTFGKILLKIIRVICPE